MVKESRRVGLLQSAPMRLTPRGGLNPPSLPLPNASLAPTDTSSTTPKSATSVSAAASLVTFSDWGRHTSAQLAKKLEGLGIGPKPENPRRQAQLNLWEMGRALVPSSPDSALIAVNTEGRPVKL